VLCCPHLLSHPASPRVLPLWDPEGPSDNGAFRKAFPDGVGSLFYALLITATIYKIHDKHKVLTEIAFQMVFTCNRIPFVCNSWIYELLHNKMELPLVPMGGTGRGTSNMPRRQKPSQAWRNCNSRPTSNPWGSSVAQLENLASW
jgi:hypothetical protein